jgi:hypothetical protein
MTGSTGRQLPTHLPPFAQRIATSGSGHRARFPTGGLADRLGRFFRIVETRAGLRLPPRQAEKTQNTVSTSALPSNLMKFIGKFCRKSKFTVSTS